MQQRGEVWKREGNVLAANPIHEVVNGELKKHHDLPERAMLLIYTILVHVVANADPASSTSNRSSGASGNSWLLVEITSHALGKQKGTNKDMASAFHQSTFVQGIREYSSERCLVFLGRV